MKLRLEVITPKGKRLLDAARMLAEIDRAKKETATDILNDYKKTTATWRHSVKFYSTRRANDYFIVTNDDIYAYVDQGTRPHEILPKRRGGRLRFFRTGFRPKSRVGYIASYAGASANSNLTYSKGVHHPGTKARGFSEKIAEKWRKEWEIRVRAAIKKAVEK